MPVSNQVRDRPTPYWQSGCGRAIVYVGDCRDVMIQMDPNQFHTVVTDPPYELGFMGHAWDSTGVAYDPRTWTGAMHVTKPGAHLLSFGGTRIWHRMACAVEDAGWEIRDTVMWVYGSGFPKGQNVSAAIDKILGFERKEVGKSHCGLGAGQFTQAVGVNGGYGFKNEFAVTEPATDAARQWNGWNTQLKPAIEPIVLARKPMSDTVAQCVLDHGTGALNIDRCKIGTTGGQTTRRIKSKTSSGSGVYQFNNGEVGSQTMNGGFIKKQVDGRHPANLIHDGGNEVVNLLPNDAARFFYSAKADSDDRPHGKGATVHPTVKPLDLMQYLVRLVCAPGGWVLDPFMGSGSTGCAAIAEGMRFVGIEQSQEYADIAVGRLVLALAGRAPEDTPDAPAPPTRRVGSTALPPKKLRGT